MKDTKVWIWIVGAVCGLELFVIAIVGGAGIGAFFGLEGVLVASIGAGVSVVALPSLVAHRNRIRSG